MIFEWYTGSQKSSKKAKQFYKLFFRLREQLPLETLIRRIERLAKRERDRNVRAKFLAAARSLRLRLGDRASHSYPAEKLLKEFDPYAANFPWVIGEYLDTCLSAVAESAKDHEREEVGLSNAPHALAQVLWSDVGLDEDTSNDAVGMLASALLHLGEEFDSPVLLRMAVVAAIRAHHGDPEDPAALWVLARAYKRLGDTVSEARVLDQLRQVEFEAEGESQSRIQAFTERFESLLGLGGEPDS